MEYTALKAAELYGLGPEEFFRMAYENSMRFYNLKD